MKLFSILVYFIAVCIMFPGCKTVPREHEPLKKYTMHGNDSIVPTKPVKNSYIKEVPKRKTLNAIPSHRLSEYYNKIPDAIRQYNIAAENMQQKNSGVLQDDISRDFIFAVIDYELKKIKFRHNHKCLEIGIKRNEMLLPKIDRVDNVKLFKSTNLNREKKRNFNIMYLKYDNLRKIDLLVSKLLTECGLNESDRFYFKKLAILRYEFIGLTWLMYEENEKMRELL